MDQAELARLDIAGIDLDSIKFNLSDLGLGGANGSLGDPGQFGEEFENLKGVVLVSNIIITYFIICFIMN